MKIIGTKGKNVNFIIHDTFNSNLFIPIGKYVNWKLENNWDDYNELYHAISYIKSLDAHEDIWYEIHTIEENKKIKGVLTIVGGSISKLESSYDINNKETIFLKYFHIIEKGKGYGSQ